MTLLCPKCGSEFRPSVEPLTKKQFDIFVFIEAFIRSRGIAPTFAEIAVEFRLGSLATVHEHVTKLEAKGLIGRGMGPRNIVLHVRSDEIGELPAPSASDDSAEDDELEVSP